MKSLISLVNISYKSSNSLGSQITNLRDKIDKLKKSAFTIYNVGITGNLHWLEPTDL